MGRLENQMNKGVCIQIGLGWTAEYDYLAEDDWKSKMQDNHRNFHIPVFLHKYNKWKYYGIDADGDSIAHLIKTKDKRDNVQWIQAAISNDKIIELNHNRFHMNPFFDTCLVPAITFDDLLDLVGIEEIAILAIDIEGQEIDILKEYSWDIKPEYIAVEVHANHNHTIEGLEENSAEMLCVVESEGYVLCREFGTNIRDGISYTNEMQFAKV